MSFEYFVFSNVYIHYLVECTHPQGFAEVIVYCTYKWSAILYGRLSVSKILKHGYQEILPTIKHIITGIQEEYILVKYVDFISVFH